MNFVSDELDLFLHDIAQISGMFNYNEISAFENDVFSPKDKNLRAVKKIYSIWKRDAEYDDEVENDCIFLDVANVVRGVTDFNEGSTYKDLETLKYLETLKETELDEEVTSAEFQRMAPAKVVSMTTFRSPKKVLGKKDKYNRLGEALFKDSEECVIEIKEDGKWKMVGIDRDNPKGFSTDPHPKKNYKIFPNKEKAKESAIFQRLKKDDPDGEGKNYRINVTDGENHL